MGFELEGIGIDHDLPVAAAEGLRHGGAGHARDLVADVELGEVAELRFVEALAFEGDQADGKARGVELQNDGGQGAGGKPPQLRHGEVRDGSDGGIGVRAGLEVDFDYADAGKGAGFDVLDTAAKSEEALETAGDIGLDLFGRHAGVESGHDDDRDVHGGEHIDRHAQQAGGAKDSDEEADDDDEIRVPDREAGHG